jgi:hypothetical protein
VEKAGEPPLLHRGQAVAGAEGEVGRAQFQDVAGQEVRLERRRLRVALA